MNIGEVAALSGVNSKMIRRYEDLGIIPKAGRSSSGYRVYSENDVQILHLVKRARELGFSMKDTKQLMKLWKSKKRSSAQVKAIADKHILGLEMKLSRLKDMLLILKDISKNCHGDDRPDCSILEGLTQD